MLRRELPTLDSLLQAHADALGRDLAAYRNHAYRVANLCLAQTTGGEEVLEKVQVAAAFHDIGIWTGRTFDYLPSSIELARAHLARTDRSRWTAEITTMVLEHHKLTRYRESRGGLVEAFRRADRADLTVGLVAHGLPRPIVRAVLAAWPNAGFHRRLAELALARLRTHPLSPLPMLRL